jgi:hypothetical protein
LTDITWTTEQRKLSDLIEWDKNPRTLSKHDGDHLKKSITKFGLADPLVINLDNHLIGGHQRKHIMGDPNQIVDVRVPSRQLTVEEAEELGIRLNANQGKWDFDILANQFETPDLLEWGFTEFQLGIDPAVDYNEAWKGMPEFENTEKAIKTLYIHFETQDAVDEFTKIIGQNITEKTKYIWYPAKERQDLKLQAFQNES